MIVRGIVTYRCDRFCAIHVRELLYFDSNLLKFDPNGSVSNTHYLFRSTLRTKEGTDHYLHQGRLSLLMHIGVSWPGWKLAVTEFRAWASYQIRKIAGAHALGMPGTFSPPWRVSDPDMHHGTCVTHVPWCMPGSLTSSFLWSRRRGETFPAFPAHAQPVILRIWQEAHGWVIRSI